MECTNDFVFVVYAGSTQQHEARTIQLPSSEAQAIMRWLLNTYYILNHIKNYRINTSIFISTFFKVFYYVVFQ